MLDPDEIKEAFRDTRFKGEPVLQTLLAALRMTNAHHHFAASEHVERAIYKFRESEFDDLCDKLQREVRKPPPPTGPSDLNG